MCSARYGRCVLLESLRCDPGRSLMAAFWMLIRVSYLVS